MLRLVKTLLAGSAARAEEAVADHFAIDLLEQKIREASDGLAGAKETLATLILRERVESRNLDATGIRLADLEERTRAALAAGDDGLATEAAAAIADLENEREMRRNTVSSLTSRIARMRLSVEKSHRRIVDLKQGLIQARALDAEHRAQRQLDRTVGRDASMREAEALLKRVLCRDDPAEESAVLDGIDAELTGSGIRDRMAAAGYGPATKVRAADVLARLRRTA